MTTDRKILIIGAAIVLGWIAAGMPFAPDESAPGPPTVIVTAPELSAIIATDTGTAEALAEFYKDAAAILPAAVESNGQLRQALQKSTLFYFPTIGTADQYPGYSAAVSDFLIRKIGTDPEKYDSEKTRDALQALETIHR
jgi:hypothetical protein